MLDVYNSDGSQLTEDQIYMQLEKIWNSSLQTNKEPIGILTSQHRNTWGKAYNNLLKGEAGAGVGVGVGVRGVVVPWDGAYRCLTEMWKRLNSVAPVIDASLRLCPRYERLL